MLLQPRPAPSICSPSLLGRSLRPLRENVLLKKLQVKADPDLPGRDFVHQECAGCGAFAFLFCGNFCHWNFSPMGTLTLENVESVVSTELDLSEKSS